MNINKLALQTSERVESGTKNFVSAISDVVSKEVNQVQQRATGIAANYSKAISQVVTNVIQVNNTEQESSSLDKIYAKLERGCNKVIKINDDADEIKVSLYCGKNNDYIKLRDGKIYRIRYSKDNEHNKTLVAVADAYASRGIKVPRMMTVNIDGKRGVASQLLTDLLPKETDPKSCYKVFGLDVLFGFRNAYSKGTTSLNNEGEVVRISTSGSAGYRVRGEKRSDFTEELTELRTFLDPNVNPESAEFLKDMTREDLLASITLALDVYFSNDVIKKRLSNLREFWMRATLTPQEEGESLLQYVTRVQNIIKEVHRENAIYSQKLREIVDNYPPSEDKFTDNGKELCKDFINKIENANDIPKAVYNRHFSREEMLKLAKMEMRESKSQSSCIDFVNLTDEPEIHSRVLYRPGNHVQATLDELVSFSKYYGTKRLGLNSGHPGRCSMLEQGLLDKYSKGEISFDELNNLSDIEPDGFEIIKKMNLFEPILGRKTPLPTNIIKMLASMSDENREKIFQRPEVLQDLPYRSKPLSKDDFYEILELEDEEYQRMLKYHLLEDNYPDASKRLFDIKDIKAFSKMSDEELDVVLERGLLKHRKELEPNDGQSSFSFGQLSSFEIQSLASLSDEQFNVLIERGLLSGKYSSLNSRRTLINTCDFTQKELELIANLGVSIEDGCWNAEQLRRILNLPNKNRIRELIELKSDISKKTSDCGWLYNDKIIDFADLPEDAYQRALSIMKNDELLNGVFIKGRGIYEASLLNENEWETLQKRGLLDVKNSRYADLDTLIFGGLSDSLKKLYPNDTKLTLLSKIPDEKWEQFIRFGLISTNPNKGQFHGDDLFRISNFSEEEFEKLLKTKIFDSKYNPDEHRGLPFTYYHSLYSLEEIVKTLTIDEIEKLVKLNFFTSDDVNSTRALYTSFDINNLKDVVNLTGKQFENFKKVKSLPCSTCGSDTLALKIVEKFNSDAEIQRILDRNLYDYALAFNQYINVDERLANIVELVNLTDDEWKYVAPTMHSKIYYGHGGTISTVIAPGIALSRLVEFVNGRNNIYEFSFKERQTLLNLLIHTGGFECRQKNLIPDDTIIPKTMYQRNSLIEELIESITLSSNTLPENERNSFFDVLSQMSLKESGVMSTNFDSMNVKLQNKISSPKLLYSREKFVSDVYEKIKDLSLLEQKKIFYYFSFDIEKNAQGNLILQGYPNCPNKNDKVGEIYKDYEENVKRVIDNLRPIVDKFTNGNKVFVEGNPKLEAELNNIISVFPELITTIGKAQHSTHDFTVDIHTLKVLQSIMSDPRYEKLSDNNKKILQISAILHDLTKLENRKDKAHPAESAFEAYYLLGRLNLSRQDKLKIYEIIRNHDWLERLNQYGLTPEEYNKRLKTIAFAHRQNDCFELASILTKADLESVKSGDVFYNKYKDAYDKHGNEVQKLVSQIKATSIPIPQTRVPKASEIIIDNEIAKEVTYDGVKNVVINMKPGQDLSKIGFDAGVLSDEFNAIVHAFDQEEQATVLCALGFVDSDALLSSSWVNYGKGNYKVFRGQGFVLKVDSDDIHAGQYCDFGSGYKKDYETLLNEYIFGTLRANVRKYWSNAIKNKFELSDDDYKQFYQNIKNKPFNVIKVENPDVAQKLQELIDDMDVKRRKGGRNYNEWLISRPEIQAGFFWGTDSSGKPKTIKDVPVFIRDYCAENDIPIIFFGE